MDTIDIEEAKANLAALVERAANGEAFVIAEGGTPRVKVEAVQVVAEKPKRRLGFLKGVYNIPDDFKAFGREDIEEMFYGPKE